MTIYIPIVESGLEEQFAGLGFISILLLEL